MSAPVITTTKTSPFLTGLGTRKAPTPTRRKPRARVPEGYIIWQHQSRRVFGRGE